MSPESYSFAVEAVDEEAGGGQVEGPARSESWARGGSEEAKGVYLTWQDLWVTTSSFKSKSTTILAGLTGYARPGEVLAIMGPSGCGKSTLLDALSGRLASSMSQSGFILVNGRKQALAYGTSAYVTQDDVLMTTLTVREALYYSAELLLPNSLSKAQKRERADTVIKEMGLQEAMNTRIGGRSSKGISGGQRRRLSICIEMLTRPKLLFLDEPTSGLDSAASYHVMSRIADLARRHGRTVIASIHQPSSEVFDLFDNLCLLSSGNTIYFGPISLTSEFFASNGFPCPQMRNPSDHFLRTINKDFNVQIKVIGEGSEHHPTDITSDAINILERSYKSSSIFQQVLRQVAQSSNMKGEIVKRGSQAPFFTQCCVLTKRSFVNMYRDPGYYWLRLAIYFAICLSIGTIFYDIGFNYESIQARGSMLMFVAGYLTFMAIGGFPSFVEDLKIFRRERLNGHYKPVAFTIANMLSSAPFIFLISVLPAAIAYYMVGLQRGPQHFIFFTLILYSSMLIVEGLMMIVASIVPDYLMGIITGATIQAMMVLACGFFRLPGDLPKPIWKYPLYYIAFHKYANQGYYKNEFLGLNFSGNGGGNSSISGEEVLKDYWQMEVGYSKWVDLAILIGMVVAYRFLFWVAVKVGEEVKPMVSFFLLGKKKHVLDLPSSIPVVVTNSTL
ncbi:ABC transporter G family member 11 [Dendrobium catenatum]|nr:ABC transporter G family member 11 [Dendrobium catenatum]